MTTLAEIEAARDRIAGAAIRTPLVRLQAADAPAEIYLKLETLQPVNSFKIRGATNAVLLASPADRAHGIVTASAGNMAQGVAWAARELGLPATILVPDTAPEAKLSAITRLGGTIRTERITGGLAEIVHDSRDLGRFQCAGSFEIQRSHG